LNFTILLVISVGNFLRQIDISSLRGGKVMGRNGLILVLILVLLFPGCIGEEKTKRGKEVEKLTGTEVKKLRVTLDFDEFPRKYTCDGEDVSPRIRISGIPEEAKSIAIIMDDPDAPIGVFTHWVIWNIPPMEEIPEGIPKDKIISSPIKAYQGVNDFRRIGYGGPCPPPGKPHRYFFKVYALDSTLDLPPGSTRNELEEAIKNHVIAKGEAMARYGR